MTPYYQDDHGLTLYCGDALAVLRELPVGSVDAVVTDPPYGTTSLEWDRWVPGWMSELACLKPTGSVWCFGSLRMFMEHHGEFADWKLAQEIVWEKHNGSSFHADRFKRVHELAVQFYRGEWAAVFKNPITTPDATARTVRRKQRPPHTGSIEAGSFRSVDGGPRLMRSVLQVRSCHGSAQHPTQKPTGIVDPLVRYSCPTGGTTCDPFCGSGTSLVVAKKLGLRAVGIEINEEFCKIAVQRLQQGVLEYA